MAAISETNMEHADLPLEEHDLEHEDEYPAQESPGMKKVQHLQTSHLEDPIVEVPANFVARPASSGSTGGSECNVYADARKRDTLHFSRQHVAGLFTISSCPRHPRADAGEANVEDYEHKQDPRQRQR
jgi:hypothetical protein